MIRKLSPLALSAAFAFTSAFAQDNAACTLPGELVIEDAAGDDLLAPTGQGFGDIHTLHMAEPGGGNTLVFTYKMADLAVMPPNTLWTVIFVTDVPPTTGTEYFVAMLTDPAGAAHLVHGTVSPADPSQPAVRIFTPAGPLEAASNFNPDGTITLALDKLQVGGLAPGGFVYGFIPVTHRITPTDGTQPFTYGIRGLNAGVTAAYDDAGDGIYEVVGSEACGGKAGILGVGAFSPLALLLLAGLATPGLRRRSVR